MSPVQISRFWEKVNKEGSTPSFRPELGKCWIWTGAIKAEGYGEVGFNYKVLYSHRVSYELLVSPITNGMDLDHLCRVRSCVNPLHLEPVTHKINMERGFNRNRNKKRCKRGHLLSGINLKIYGRRGKTGTRRHCRACQRIRNVSRP